MSLTWEEFWEFIQAKNPSLAKGEARMSTKNFEKAMRLAWTKGYEACASEKSLWEEIMGEKSPPGYDKRK